MTFEPGDHREAGYRASAEPPPGPPWWEPVSGAVKDFRPTSEAEFTSWREHALAFGPRPSASKFEHATLAAVYATRMVLYERTMRARWVSELKDKP